MSTIDMYSVFQQIPKITTLPSTLLTGKYDP